MSEHEKLISITDSSRDGISYSVHGSSIPYILQNRDKIINQLEDVIRRLRFNHYPFRIANQDHTTFIEALEHKIGVSKVKLSVTADGNDLLVINYGTSFRETSLNIGPLRDFYNAEFSSEEKKDEYVELFARVIRPEVVSYVKFFDRREIYKL